MVPSCVLWLPLLLPLLTPLVRAACVCADPSLCAPLDVPQRLEVFGFATDARNFVHYPLDILTTIANFAGPLDPQMLCLAHSRGVKVVASAPFPREQLHNASYLAAFIALQIDIVTTQFVDGINFDFEDPLDASDGDAAALTRVIASTAAALKAATRPYVTVSVDVAWSPNCIDLRCYDYAGIAAAADLLFVMAYDMRSQVFWPAPCIASANSPLPLVLDGMANWTGAGLNVDPSKLILGVPWYGYHYLCIGGPAPDVAVCPIERVAWRGVNCSDAVGSEIDYSVVRRLLKNNATRPRTWNDTLASPFFNIIDSSSHAVAQIWYDDPSSLQLRYDAAKAAGWRGVGQWNLDSVVYGSSEPDEVAETAAMWAAMRSFRD